MAQPILTENDQKERFSLTYLSAIATSAGFSCDEPRMDRDSIDANIRASGVGRPQLDVQLKATSSPDIKADGLHFSLVRKNYDDLREKSRMTPAILAVYEMPALRMDWFTCANQQGVLRSRMWWLSLYGYPETKNAYKTVVLPVAQLLTPASLKAILTQISQGNRP